MLFELHASRMSEKFWEGIVHLTDKHVNLLSCPIDEEFVEHRSSQYVFAVYQKSAALEIALGL